MDRRINRLHDGFTHGHLDRRPFLDRLSRLVGSTAAAPVLLPRPGSNHARARTVPETDRRLRTGAVASRAPGGR